MKLYYLTLKVKLDDKVKLNVPRTLNFCVIYVGTREVYDYFTLYFLCWFFTCTCLHYEREERNKMCYFFFFLIYLIWGLAFFFCRLISNKSTTFFSHFYNIILLLELLIIHKYIYIHTVYYYECALYSGVKS